MNYNFINMFNLWKEDAINNTSSDNLSLFRFVYLNIKTVYSTWATRLVILLSPILVTLALAVMMPLHWYIGAGQTFVTTLSAGTIWAMTYFSFRRSTLFKNIKGTSLRTHQMYLSIFITMLLVTFISEVLFWLSSIAFSYIIPNSLMENILDSTNHSYTYEWIKFDWLTLIYSWLMQVSLMFVAAFALRSIFNTEKNCFIILFVFVLLLFPFGGLFKFSYIYDPLVGVIPNKWNILKWISFIFPQTSLNYFSYVSVDAGTITDTTVALNNSTMFASWQISTSFEWNLVIFYPLFCLALLSLISILTIDLD